MLDKFKNNRRFVCLNCLLWLSLHPKAIRLLSGLWKVLKHELRIGFQEFNNNNNNISTINYEAVEKTSAHIVRVADDCERNVMQQRWRTGLAIKSRLFPCVCRVRSILLLGS